MAGRWAAASAVLKADQSADDSAEKMVGLSGVCSAGSRDDHSAAKLGPRLVVLMVAPRAELRDETLVRE